MNEDATNITIPGILNEFEACEDIDDVCSADFAITKEPKAFYSPILQLKLEIVTTQPNDALDLLNLSGIQHISKKPKLLYKHGQNVAFSNQDLRK